MLSYRLLSTDDYKALRYQVLLNVEETGDPKEDAYLDSKGIPTIGIGFNLRERLVREAVLKKLGFNIDEAASLLEKQYLNEIKTIVNTNHANNAALCAALNEVMNRRYHDSRIPAANRTHATFQFANDGEIQAVFDDLIITYEDVVNAWLPGIPATAPERAVLVSLAWNNAAKLLGNGLKNALQTGNRAEAWYEIRYNSNGDKLPGIARRRYYESELFGLYDSGTGTTDKTESLQTYQMYTAHREKILTYEATYGDRIATANNDYNLSGDDRVRVLKDELASAATVLMNDYIKDEYGRTRDFNPLNIQVASDKAFILAGEEIDTRTGSRDDLLIGRENGQNWLAGCAGNDVLIGGAGNDYLDGGEGDDILIGGEGVDTYIIKGHDRIVDVGRNNIVWNGQLIAGVFAAEEGQAGMYRFISDDQEWSLVFHSPGQLTLSAADSVTFENQTSAGAFSGCDFGFYLTESRTPAEVTGITVRGDLKAYLFKDCDGHYTTMTNGYGNIIVDEDTPQPGRADTLFGSGLNDALYGLGGDDELLSRDGDDTLDGGDGSDRLMGDNFDQTGSGNDQLFGGDGDDELLGDDGHDRLEGGEGDVGAGHPEKADDYALSWRLAA